MVETLRLDSPCAAATGKLLCEVRRLAPLARNLHGRQELTLLDQAGKACGQAPRNVVRLVERAFTSAGAGGIHVVANAVAAPTSFRQLLSQRVSAALSYRHDQWPTDADTDQALTMLEAFDFAPPPPGGRHQMLVMADGVQVSTYTSIAPGKPPVLMVLPCGMPFGLCQDWFEVLSQGYSVLACESRGLFGAATEFDPASLDLNRQLADLFGLLDHHGISSAHVMGLCGGAVLAMRAVQRQPGRFQSMSLWYGDYHVADQALRTHHQKNFDWLMAEAGQSLAQARDLQKMFTDPAILATVPERIAHWVLHPYANPESLYRYARLNASLNNEDVTASLPALTLPTLVVAGDSDSTTHSGASAFVAAGMPRARFELERNGNHQEFFSVPQRSCELALRFLSGQVSA